MDNKETSTHLLGCRQVICRNGRTYWMHCNILKTMPDGRLKVMVFGDRDHEGYEDKKRIRYVDSWRVKPKMHGGL